ncbi:MAG: methyltransferase domain-containing protein [Alphaproteobacteria bacterium]|nr:methyltransferase domain-containing protein [Alphaproteobacteria bacterium]
MTGVNLISTKPAPQPDDGPPRLFDRALLRRRRDRASGEFADYDFLHARVADDLLDRVESIARDFDTCLVIGGGGAVGRALKDRPEAAKKIGSLIETDLSPAMARLSGHPSAALDEETLPVKERSVDLVLSCLSLHWTNDLVGALIQINYALKPDGFFAGAVLGGSTLTELRQALKTAEGAMGCEPGLRVSPYADTIDMAGLVARAGFAMPVSDVDRVTARYGNAFVLMRDLRKMGETNVLIDRPRTPCSKSLFVKAAEAYSHACAGEDGRIPATFEVIHFAGWAPHPDQPRPKRPGTATHRLADALGVRENSAGDAAGR